MSNTSNEIKYVDFTGLSHYNEKIKQVIDNISLDKLSYTTATPTFANLDGIKVAVLNVEPETKYNGWLYFIDDSVSKKLLCFTANTAGSTISMSVTGTPTLGQNFEYSTDATTWLTFTPGSTTVTLAAVGDKVYFRGDNPNGISESLSTYYIFVMTGNIAASGNIMSLIDKVGESVIIPNGYCFFAMFYGCTALTTAPILPATALTTYCYAHMFADCTSLAIAPALPATTLASTCYFAMFDSCTALTTAPALPATTLIENCYYGMFAGCTTLTTVPVLPATTLANACYLSMFQGCTSLYVSDTATTEAPNAWRIPSSETFSGNTYQQSNMFKSCLGTRSSNNMAGVAGESYTYYTQNTPVV